MEKCSVKDLLKDKRIVDEINRFKWIESEKAKRDIGWDKAVEDWMKKYSKDNAVVKALLNKDTSCCSTSSCGPKVSACSSTVKAKKK